MTDRLAKALLALSARYDSSSWVEPVDTIEHRRRLCAAVENGTRYEPVFAYARHNVNDFMSSLADVISLAEAELVGPLRAVVLSDLASQRLRAEAVAAGNDASYSAVVAKVDGLPSPDLVADAEELLAEPPVVEPNVPVIDATSAAAVIEDALSWVGLSTWSVELSAAMSASMNVNGPRHRVRVRSDARFTTRQLDRLLVHEVGGHVWRWHCASQQPEPLAVIPTGRTMPTEEGLALWGEESDHLLDGAAMRTYAARVIAVDHARNHGLFEVADRVAPYVGADAAAQIAMRAKRGLHHPDGPGGSTKDWSYLGGLRLCQSIARSAPDDLDLARGTKWSLEYLPQMRDLAADGRLTTPSRLTIDHLRHP